MRRWLLVQRPVSDQTDVWLLPANGREEARPLLTASYVERDARMSPDGRLLAYVSEESGRADVSVRSIDAPSRRVVVSPAGGSQPVWLRDGSNLAFVDPEGGLRLVAVHRGADGMPVTGAPTRPAVPRIGFGHWFAQYDVSPDGHVYFVDSRPESGLTTIGFVLGWRGLAGESIR